MRIAEIAAKSPGTFPMMAINTPTTRDRVASILLRLTRRKGEFGTYAGGCLSKPVGRRGRAVPLLYDLLGSREPLQRQRIFACIERTF
jgi:hypothetical protein